MKYFFSFLKYTFIILLALMMSGPVLTAILGSLRTSGEFLSNPFGLPVNGIHWENYSEILTSASFWSALWSSILITSGSTILSLLMASLLGFVFARIDFRGREIWFNILMIGMLFPLPVAILPVFIQIMQLNLINSYWGVILPIATFALPINTVILRNFFIAIPTELEDAAYIDGCTRFGFLRHILLPLSRPSLAAVATLMVVASWNEYFLPLLILNDPHKWPLTLGMMQFQGKYGTDWARVMAYVTLLIIPAIIFYIFTERYIVRGLTGEDLKE